MKFIYITIICLLLSSCASNSSGSKENLTVKIESEIGSSVVKGAQLEVFGCNRQFENCELLKVIRPITLGIHQVNVPSYRHYQFGVSSINCLHDATTIIGGIFSSSKDIHTIKVGCNKITTIRSNTNKPGSYSGTNENWGRTIEGP